MLRTIEFHSDTDKMPDLQSFSPKRNSTFESRYQIEDRQKWLGCCNQTDQILSDWSDHASFLLVRFLLLKGKTKTRSKLQNPCKLLHQYFNPIKKIVVYYSYISLQNSHFFTWPYLLLFNFLFRFVIFASLTKISMRHYNLFPVFSSITYCLLFR